MKRILLFSSLLLSASLSWAQEEGAKPQENNAYIGISGGLVLPVGNFYSKSLTNEKAGMASNGYNLAAQAGFRFSKSFAIGGRFYYATNSVDHSFYPDSTNVSITSWKYSGLVVGPIFTEQITSCLDMNFKFLFGGGIATSPRVKYAKDVLIPSRDSKLQFAWSTGIGFQYRFTKDNKLFALADIDYLEMKPSFKYQDETYKRKIQGALINLGIGYNLR